MRKGYIKTSAILTAMMLMLTGCGASYPELTAEEEVMVGEYAAKLLLKYDANNRSRLLVREEAETVETEEKQEEAKESVEEPEEITPEADTPVIEVQPEQNADMIGSPEEFYELGDGIVIHYQGMEVCDSYPEAGEADAYFALDAAEGKRLLVLKFGIENHAQSDRHIDLLAQDAILRITANGSYTRNVLTTMLMDDMSTYIGDIPAGEAVDVVLLAEADTDVADNISTLMLNMKNELKTCTIQLK